MKFSFSAILLLTPLISAPIALAVSKDDPECINKYCVKYNNANSDCGKSAGVDILNVGDADKDAWNAYLQCFCHGSLETVYKQCLACYKDPSPVIEEHDTICQDSEPVNDSGNDDDSDSDSTTTDTNTDSTTTTTEDKTNETTTTEEEKKNDAGALKSSSGLKMAGVMVFVAGGIAAM